MLGCDSGGQGEAGYRGLKGWRLTEALEDGNSYGFGVSTKWPLPALTGPHHYTCRDSQPRAGSLSCPSRGFLMPFLLCTDFVLQEKEEISG